MTRTTSSKVARAVFTPRCTFSAGRKVAASAGVNRRDLLMMGEGALLLQLLGSQPAVAAEEGARVLPVEQLAVFQRGDQRAEFQQRAEDVLKSILTPDDAPAVLRLAFHDAATYDVATKTGGFDGSIVLSDELNRPENVGLKPLVARLAEAKKQIDAGNAAIGSGPISWADTIYLAGKVSTQASWIQIKLKGTKGGLQTVKAFGSDWPVVLGRVDNPAAAPTGRIPASDAPAEEIKQFMLALGAKPGASTGPFAPRPPFWERPAFVIWTAAAESPAAEEARLAAADPAFAEFKKKYDISRATVTRTDYEVDFSDYFNRLTSLGATFNPDAYLHPIPLGKFKL